MIKTLKRLLPIIFPKIISEFFSIEVYMVIVSSGIEAPKAAIVKPITIAGILFF
jgi:hypothetical protein